MQIRDRDLEIYNTHNVCMWVSACRCGRVCLPLQLNNMLYYVQIREKYFFISFMKTENAHMYKALCMLN